MKRWRGDSGLCGSGFPYLRCTERLENSQRPLFLFAVAGSNVHPAWLARLTMGWRHFVVDR